MFVRTEDQQILNLDFYARIRCHSFEQRHEIYATTNPSLKGDANAHEVCIAKFEGKGHVEGAFDSILDAIRKNKPVWDAIEYKTGYGKPPLDK